MVRWLKAEASVPIIAVLSIGTTIILGAVTFFFSTTSELSNKITTVQEINTEQSSQIAATGATIQAVQTRLEHMDKQLDRIESKLTGTPVSKITE